MNLDSGVTADAASMAGYNRVAAAQWAKSQLGSKTSVLFGTRYWYVGGDCANFVSEALYMGGLEPSVGWNHNGYLAHMAMAGVTNGAWIRVKELHDHLVSIGAKDIVNPSPSQIEIGMD